LQRKRRTQLELFGRRGGVYAHVGDTAKKDYWITGRKYRNFRRSDVNIGKYISVIHNFCAASEFPRIPTS